MYAVVILNKYESVIQPLLQSIREKISPIPPIIIVMDGHKNNYGYHGVPYDEEHFAFARAANIGIRAAPDLDIILINDDCCILEWNFFEGLRIMAYTDPLIGILSPLIMGCVGNEVQRWHERERHWKPDMDFIDVQQPSPVCFPCVYIKRKVFNYAGLMNEQIAGYGFDDHDMCSRARYAGFKTCVTQRCVIQHADGSDVLAPGRGKSWATSYMKRWPGRGTPTQKECADYISRHFK